MTRLFTLLLFCLVVAACSGPQSAFDAQGPEASSVLILTWVMFIGGSLIFGLVFVLTVLAMFGPESWKAQLCRPALIIGSGIVFPVVVLTALLFWGFGIMRSNVTAATEAENPLEVSVVGEQWWWRITYQHPDGTTTETANELHIPVGRTVRLRLTSADVLHSFWVPAYAGKLDMIPGRENILHFRADEPGLVRGQCAEYCGGAHALMSFYVVAHEPAEFEAWLAGERSDAVPGDEIQGDEVQGGDGEALFQQAGCGACHTVRGTPANGTVGPDLTHVGARQTIGAGIMPASRQSFAAWIEDHREIKPDNLMPPYEFLTQEQVTELAAYLDGLE